MDNLDIDINPVTLGSTLDLLVDDSKEINRVLKEITKLVEEIDTDKWNSPERKSVDEELIPFLKYEENHIVDEINNCNIVIKNAIDLYQRKDNAIKIEAGNIVEFKEVT